MGEAGERKSKEKKRKREEKIFFSRVKHLKPWEAAWWMNPALGQQHAG